MEMYNNLITRNNYQKAVANEIIFYYANLRYQSQNEKNHLGFDLF